MALALESVHANPLMLITETWSLVPPAELRIHGSLQNYHDPISVPSKFSFLLAWLLELRLSNSGLRPEGSLVATLQSIWKASLMTQHLLRTSARYEQMHDLAHVNLGFP